MSAFNSGMYLPKDVASSTTGFEYRTFSSNVQGQSNENSTSNVLPPEYYNNHTLQISSLQQDVAKLQKLAEVSQAFFKQSVLLQRVCLAIIILLPIVLALVVAMITRFFCSNEEMLLFAKWILRIICGVGIVDLFVILGKNSIDKERFEHIERRLDSLEK